MRREGAAQRRAYAAAWLLLAVLFVSPICALGSALFSARVAHHVVLVAVAAPLLALSLPTAWRRGAPAPANLTALFLLHTAVLWLWHAPGPYTAALSSDLLFWVMQLGLLATAVALWRAVLSPRAPFGAALGVLLGSIIQMGLLGALITFARQPLYPPHFGVTEPFGLDALADQQLAGLIMWVPAVTPYLAACLWLLHRRLQREATAAHPA